MAFRKIEDCLLMTICKPCGPTLQMKWKNFDKEIEMFHFKLNSLHIREYRNFRISFGFLFFRINHS